MRLSIVQPEATVALNGSKNAGILATSIIGAFDPAVLQKVALYKKKLEAEVMEKVEKLKGEGWGNKFDIG